ncbi:hypothetical protein FA048_09640 [Pedobacter polaris]|uniref:Uncharacterized protein n=1 Tax=Pedobacter polaris TaxID=2571273 RepID=A0A4U1CWR9_9SPHI|nr:hypothetical protein [Pedobacter polaris]TKC10438.1 hypothetical protein FA048_09640 [Pedobacter polaris]
MKKRLLLSLSLMLFLLTSKGQQKIRDTIVSDRQENAKTERMLGSNVLKRHYKIAKLVMSDSKFGNDQIALNNDQGESRKYRIRKKFNIPSSEDMYLFILNCL